jgi:hypothetical protein
MRYKLNKLQVHRKTWRNHTFLNWEALDLTHQEIREGQEEEQRIKR